MRWEAMKVLASEQMVYLEGEGPHAVPIAAVLATPFGWVVAYASRMDGLFKTKEGAVSAAEREVAARRV